VLPRPPAIALIAARRSATRVPNTHVFVPCVRSVLWLHIYGNVVSSWVSRLEKGTHIPQLPTLQRIAAVLDEELIVCFQRTVDGEVEREFAAVA
jgi:hypothetical protein